MSESDQSLHSTTPRDDLGGLLDRLCGGAGIVGGLALAAAYLAHPPTAPVETVASVGWLWIHVGFMISLLAGIFLLQALLARYLRAGGGLSGCIGFALAVVSMVFVFGLDYSEVFIFPTLAVEFPAVVERYGDGTSMPSVAFAFPATGVMFLVGFVLFGWQLGRRAVISRPASTLLLIGTVVFALGLSGMLPMLVVRIGAVLFGAGLIWLGVTLLQRR